MAPTLFSSLNHAWMSTRSHFHSTTLLLVITRILNLICRFQTSRLNPHYGIQPTPVTVPILLQGIWCDIKREDDEELCVSLSLFASLTSRAVRHKINIARQVFRQPPRTTQGELERKPINLHILLCSTQNWLLSEESSSNFQNGSSSTWCI